jgi:glutathione peroxidase
MRFLMTVFLILAANAAFAFQFENIDGGIHDLDKLRGNPVLVVNTASRCAFTHQYDALQKLYDTYRDKGLVVLAVPSDDFRQELASNEDIKEFCALNFDLDLPMTGMTPVTGSAAHPFYAWVKKQTGFQPIWNFNKILLDADGKVAETYRSSTSPTSGRIRQDVERLLRP